MTLQGNVKNEINEQLRALQTTDSAHPNTFNPLFQDLLDNDVTLDKKIDDTKQEIEGVKEYVDDKAEITYNEAKAYTDSLVSSITETGVASLGQYSYTLTATTNGQLDFEIPLTIFDKNVDSLSIVALNRQYLGVEDYEITDNITEGRTLTLKVDPSEVTVGSTINLLILKNVPVGANGTFSGAHLQNDTVTKSKLEPSLRTDIEKIPAIENQLITGQSETVVLNRGDNNVEAELDSIVKAINFEPQTIVNHVPLFDSGAWTLHANATVVDSTTLRVTPTGDFQQSKIEPFHLKGDTTYTITYELSGVDKNVYVNIGFYDSSNVAIGYAYSESNKGTTQLTFKTPSNLSYCKLFVTTETNNGQTYTIKNISIVEGSQPKPFVANVKGTHNPSIINKTNGTYLTLLSTFHEGDEVFVDTDGKLKVRRKWKEIELTGDEDWEFHSTPNNVNLKVVRMKSNLGVAINPTTKGELVNYSGEIVLKGYVEHGRDYEYFNNILDTNYLHLSIPNSKSGWGPNYTPTKEEIQAYFKGWRMYTVAGPGNTSTLYNGTGTKAWVPIWEHLSGKSGAWTQTLPTTMVNLNEKWQPYRLIYELATPTVETIQTVGNLRLEEGTNELELTEGIIRREVANPIVYKENGYSYINWTAYTKTLLKYKLNKLIAVYKNGELDDNWVENDFEGYGNYRLFKRNKIDPTAVYTVDYIPLEPYKVTAPIKTLTIEYTSSLGSMVEKLVEESSEQENRISVIERDMVRKGEGITWITPTILNGYYISDSRYFCKYGKDSLGNVYIHFALQNVSGFTAENTKIFVLPKGFRPRDMISVSCVGAGNSNAFATIDNNGDVKVTSQEGKGGWIGLNAIFKAEQ